MNYSHWTELEQICPWVFNLNWSTVHGSLNMTSNITVIFQRLQVSLKVCKSVKSPSNSFYSCWNVALDIVHRNWKIYISCNASIISKKLAFLKDNFVKQKWVKMNILWRTQNHSGPQFFSPGSKPVHWVWCYKTLKRQTQPEKTKEVQDSYTIHFLKTNVNHNWGL